MDPILKFFYPTVKAIDPDQRRITVCISKDEIDRHGERIEIEAISQSLAIYKTNPVILGDHQHRLPTGESSVIGHSPPDSYVIHPDSIDMDIIFSVNKNAETYWVNYRDGHQKAVSIGFLPLEWQLEDVNGKKILVYTKIELFEVSCVAVGSNRGALVKKAGKFDSEPADVAAKSDSLDEQFDRFKATMAEKFDNIQVDLEEIKTLLTPDQDELGRSLLGDPHNQFDPAGDPKTAERIRTQLQEINNL